MVKEVVVKVVNETVKPSLKSGGEIIFAAFVAGGTLELASQAYKVGKWCVSSTASDVKKMIGSIGKKKPGKSQFTSEEVTDSKPEETQEQG